MASEGKATEAQTKRLYAVLHSLGTDYKKFEKDFDIKLFPIGNPKAPTQGQCHAWIDELEAQEQGEGAKGFDKGPGDVTYDKEGFVEERVKAEERDIEEAHVEAEVARMAVVMRFCTTEAAKIANEVCNGGGITEGTKASMVQKLATTMFIESMKRGL